MMKKKEIAVLLIAIAALLAVVVGVIWTSYSNNRREALLDAPATLIIDGEHYIRHNLTEEVIPQGYFMAGKLTKEMAYNTDLEGYTYYENPYIDDIIYVYQENDTLTAADTTSQKWAYMSWIREDVTINSASEA